MTTLIRLWCFLFVTGAQGSEWSYPEHEKAGWSGICATGQEQSPIHLVTKAAQPYKVEPLVFVHYNTMTKGNLSNNGHTAVLHVEQPCSVSITAGGLHGLYQLDEIHFHWASEHKIDRESFVLEAHFVHYNSKYKSKTEALEHHQSLAVIGVLFHVEENDNPHLQAITDAVEKITHHGSRFTLSVPFNPQQLLPMEQESFFRYKGSLTTPPCLEIVIWTVFTHSLPISQNQLKIFRTLNSKAGPLKYNYRGLKPINERTVYLISDAKINSGFKIIIDNIIISCVLFILQVFAY